MNILGPILGREVAGGGSSRPVKVAARKRESGRERDGSGLGFPKMETLKPQILK